MDAHDELLRLKSIKRKLVVRFEEMLPQTMVVSELEAREWRRRSATAPHRLFIDYDELATDEDIRQAEIDAEESRKWAEIEGIADLDERERRALQKLKEDGKL